MNPRSSRRELPVVVLGASGYTGRLVAQQLKSNGTPFAVAGRSAVRLSEVATALGIPVPQLVVPDWTVDSLGPILAAARVVINCVGPYGLLGEPVVKAAIASGTHYLDLTGEQDFVHRVVIDHDRDARKAEIAVIPSMAYEVALSDLGTRLLAGEPRASFERLDVMYLHHDAGMSRGTLRSILRIMDQQARVVDGSKYVERAPFDEEGTLDLPGEGQVTGLSIPGAELMTVPRHTPVARMRVFMGMPGVAGWFTRRMAPLAPRFMGGWLGERLRARIEAAPDGPPEESRKSCRFHIRLVGQVAGSPGATGLRSLSLKGHDPYGLTACIAARAARRMATDSFTGRGVLSPAMAFSPREFLDELSADGLTVVES